MKPPIKTYRTAKSLKQTQVARLADITVTSYQRIEYGTQTPSLPTALRIAAVLGTTVEALWGGLIDKPHNPKV